MEKTAAVYVELLAQREALLIGALKRKLGNEQIEPRFLMNRLEMKRNRNETFETVYLDGEPLVIWHDPVVGSTSLMTPGVITLSLTSSYRLFA